MGYDPTIGVWFERDPAKVSTNLNEYVGGAPTGFVDPAGAAGVSTSQPTTMPTPTQPTSQPTNHPATAEARQIQWVGYEPSYNRGNGKDEKLELWAAIWVSPSEKTLKKLLANGGIMVSRRRIDYVMSDAYNWMGTITGSSEYWFTDKVDKGLKPVDGKTYEKGQTGGPLDDRGRPKDAIAYVSIIGNSLKTLANGKQWNTDVCGGATWPYATRGKISIQWEAWIYSIGEDVLAKDEYDYFTAGDGSDNNYNFFEKLNQEEHPLKWPEGSHKPCFIAPKQSNTIDNIEFKYDDHLKLTITIEWDNSSKTIKYRVDPKLGLPGSDRMEFGHGRPVGTKVIPYG